MKTQRELDGYFSDLQRSFEELSRKQIAEFDALAGKLNVYSPFLDLPEIWPSPSSDKVETGSKDKAETGSPDEAGRTREETVK